MLKYVVMTNRPTHWCDYKLINYTYLLLFHRIYYKYGESLLFIYFIVSIKVFEIFFAQYIDDVSISMRQFFKI
jgi:hypothetical protein